MTFPTRTGLGKDNDGSNGKIGVAMVGRRGACVVVGMRDLEKGFCEVCEFWGFVEKNCPEFKELPKVS